MTLRGCLLSFTCVDKKVEKKNNLAFSEMTCVCQKLTKTAVENTKSINVKFYMLFCMQSAHTNTEQCHF